MSFINAVTCGGPGVNLEFRMHLRYEFINLGLMNLIDVNHDFDTSDHFLLADRIP